MKSSWKMLIVGGGILLGISVLMNIFSIMNPQGSSTLLELPEPAPLQEEKPTEPIRSMSAAEELSLMNDRSLAQLREACYYNLDEELDSVMAQLGESRARRWENHAQMESERLGISSYEYLLDQYKKTQDELMELMPFGALPTTAKDTVKFRDLIGKLTDLREAIASRPTGKKNIPAVGFLRAIQDCQMKAINHNNIQNIKRIEMLNEEW